MGLEVAGMDLLIWENIGQVVDMSPYLCSMLGVMNRFGKMWVLLRRMFALKKAASFKNFMLRVHVSAVLDQLENLNQKSDLPLSGKLDLPGGHVRSFICALDNSSSFWRENSLSKSVTEPRIKAAMPLSPGSRKMISPDEALGRSVFPGY